MRKNILNNYIHYSRNSISPVVGGLGVYQNGLVWGLRCGPTTWTTRNHCGSKGHELWSPRGKGKKTRPGSNVVSRIYRLFIYIYEKPSLSLSLFLGEVSPVHVISPERLFSKCIHLILRKSSVVQNCKSPRHMMRSPHLSLYLHLYLYPICTHI